MAAPIPDAILALEAIYDRAFAAIDDARKNKREIDAALRALTGRDYDDLSWDPDSRDVVEKEVRNFAGIVVRLAEAELSQHGARLDVDMEACLAPYRDAERAIRDRCRRDYSTSVDQMMLEVETEWRTFRPRSLWQGIVAHYSPEAVADLAYQRAARCLVDMFDLTRRAEPRTMKGRVELIMDLRPEEHGGGLTLRFAFQQLGAFAEAFHTFAIACFPDRDDGLAGVGRALARVERVSKRERLEFAAGIEAVVFSAAIKFYIPADVAAALNQFVTTHAAAAFERRHRAA